MTPVNRGALFIWLGFAESTPAGGQAIVLQ
jgi:hypothetical protein